MQVGPQSPAVESKETDENLPKLLELTDSIEEDFFEIIPEDAQELKEIEEKFIKQLESKNLQLDLSLVTADEIKGVYKGSFAKNNFLDKSCNLKIIFGPFPKDQYDQITYGAAYRSLVIALSKNGLRYLALDLSSLNIATASIILNDINGMDVEMLSVKLGNWKLPSIQRFLKQKLEGFKQIRLNVSELALPTILAAIEGQIGSNRPLSLTFEGISEANEAKLLDGDPDSAQYNQDMLLDLSDLTPASALRIANKIRSTNLLYLDLTNLCFLPEQIQELQNIIKEAKFCQDVCFKLPLDMGCKYRELELEPDEQHGFYRYDDNIILTLGPKEDTSELEFISQKDMPALESTSPRLFIALVVCALILTAVSPHIVPIVWKLILIGVTALSMGLLCFGLLKFKNLQQGKNWLDVFRISKICAVLLVITAVLLIENAVTTVYLLHLPLPLLTIVQATLALFCMVVAVLWYKLGQKSHQMDTIDPLWVPTSSNSQEHATHNATHPAGVSPSTNPDAVVAPLIQL